MDDTISTYKELVWDAHKEWKSKQDELNKTVSEFGEFMLFAQGTIKNLDRADEILQEFGIDAEKAKESDPADVSRSELDMMMLTSIILKMAAFYVINNRELISANFWSHMTLLQSGMAAGLEADDLRNLVPEKPDSGDLVH